MPRIECTPLETKLIDLCLLLEACFCEKAADLQRAAESESDEESSNRSKIAAKAAEQALIGRAQVLKAECLTLIAAAYGASPPLDVHFFRQADNLLVMGWGDDMLDNRLLRLEPQKAAREERDRFSGLDLD